MFIIALANEKGGVGKTMLTTNLATEVYHSGYGLSGIIDADRSAAASKWYNRRPPDMSAPIFLDIEKFGLQGALEAAERGGVQVVFIDTPGESSEAIQALFGFCDFVLIPFKASTTDLSVIGETMDIAEAAGKPFRFTINESRKSGVLTNEAMAVLSEHGPVFKTVIEPFEIFRMCGATGLAASEMKGAAAKKAAGQIADLWQNVLAYLNNLNAGKDGRRGSSKT